MTGLKYFEFIRHVYLKRMVLTVLGVLFMMAFAFIAFICTSSLVSVVRGYQGLAALRSEEVYAGNNQSDPEKLNQAYQNDPEKLAKNTAAIMASLEKTGDYVLHWRYTTAQKFPNAKGTERLTTELMFANQHFFKFYPLTVVQGDPLDNAVFQQTGSKIPVLVGANLAAALPLGHTFKLTDPGLGRSESYYVRGILQANQGIQSMYMLDSEDLLNNTIVRPLRQRDLATISPDQLSSGLQDLLVFGKATKQLPAISRQINRDQIFKVKFYSVEANINEFLTLYRQQIPLVIIALVILLGTAGFLVWNTIKTIRDSQKEITLRLALGLAPNDVFLATFILEALASVIAIGPAVAAARVLARFMQDPASSGGVQLAQTTLIRNDDLIALAIVALILLALALLLSMIARRTVRQGTTRHGTTIEVN